LIDRQPGIGGVGIDEGFGMPISAVAPICDSILDNYRIDRNALRIKE